METNVLDAVLKRYSLDNEWRLYAEEREKKRQDSMNRQLVALSQLQKGEMDIMAFKKWLQNESGLHNHWGFNGACGQKFLNMLCNNTKSPAELAKTLIQVFSPPKDKEEAISKIVSLIEFTRRENEHIENPHKKASAGCSPFFLSYFWNIQQYGRHPIYYPSAVGGLECIGLANLDGIGDSSQRYETYYDWMVQLRKDYGDATGIPVTFTDLETLLQWVYDHSEDEAEKKPEPESTSLPESAPADAGASEHTEIQWMLAKIGIVRGFKVHVANNDIRKIFHGERLGDVGGDDLPLPGFSDEDRKIIDRIDVIWFRGNEITHLFEIESTTDIMGGILRMSDLLTLVPHLKPALGIVAPNERKAEVDRVMHRPTFRRMKEDSGGREFEFKSFDDIRIQYDMEKRGAVIH
jgi:hypothetical protein